MSAVTAPLRSMMALVASVVPWRKRSISAGAMPISPSNSSVPAITACSGACGVVSTLRVQRCAPASTTRSVKVPPMSTARRLWGACLLAGTAGSHGRERGVESEIDQGRAGGIEGRGEGIADLVEARRPLGPHAHGQRERGEVNGRIDEIHGDIAAGLGGMTAERIHALL